MGMGAILHCRNDGAKPIQVEAYAKFAPSAARAVAIRHLGATSGA